MNAERLSRWLPALILGALLLACDGPSQTTTPTDASADASADAQISDQLVTVRRPSGSAEGLSVLAGDQVAVVQGGAVTLAGAEGGGTFAALVDEQDRPLLLGYVVFGQPATLDAQSTAQALLFLGSMGYHWTEAPDWPAVLALIATMPAFEPLVATIKARLAEAPLALDDEADPLYEAVNAILTALPDTVPPPLPAPTKAASMESWLLVQTPSPQSGLFVEPDTWQNGLIVRNALRRHTRIYIYRTGYVGADGRAVALTPWEPVVGGDYLKAVKALGSSLGASYDLLIKTPAYTPTQIGPYLLPVIPADAEQTTYRVIAVGPGAPGEVDASPALLTQWQGASRALALFTLSKEVVMPILSSLTSWQKEMGVGLSAHEQLGAELVNAALSAGLDIEQGLERNEWPGIILGLVRATLTNKAFREKAIGAAIHAQLLADGQGALAKRLEGVNAKICAALKVVDTGIRAGDLACVARDLAAAKTVESFEVTAVPVRVRILPEPVTVRPGEQATLTADLGPLGEQGLELTWKIPGRNGNLAVFEVGNEQRGSQVTGTRRTVVYQALSTAPVDAEEPVTVEVVRRVGQERRRIGAAEGLVRISGHRATLSPESATVRPGEAVTFSVQVTPPEGGPYTLRWQTEGRLGAFIDLDEEGRSEGLSATYQAGPDAEGEETISVQVFAPDAAEPLATLTGRLRVQRFTVSLSPQALALPPNGEGVLHAIVEPFPADGEVRFRWENSAVYGHLSNQPGLLDRFESVQESATYTAQEAAGQDTVQVEALLIQGDEVRSLGRATATVTVGEASGELSPQGPRLPLGDDLFFELSSLPAVESGVTLRCRWVNSAQAGVLWNVNDVNMERPDRFTNYCGRARYRGTALGQDHIEVEVIADRGGHLEPGGWVDGELTSLMTLRTSVEVIWSGPYELSVSPENAWGLSPGETLEIEATPSPEPVPGGVLTYSFELRGCGRLIGGEPGDSPQVRLSATPHITYEAPTDALCTAEITVDLRHTFPEDGDRLIGANSAGLAVGTTDQHPALPVQIVSRRFRTEGVEPGESFEAVAYFTWTPFPGTAFWNITRDWSGEVFPLYSIAEPPEWLGAGDQVVLIQADRTRLNRDRDPLSPEAWQAEVDAALQSLQDEVEGWTLSVVGLPER